MSASDASDGARSRTRSWASSLRIRSHGCRSDRAQQPTRLRGDRQCRAARDEVAEHGVQLVGVHEPVAQQGSHGAPRAARTPSCDPRRAHRCGVACIRADTAAAAARITSVLRRLPRDSSRTRAVAVLGTSHTDLAASDEPLREMTAQPASALDRPTPLRELLRPAQQLAIARQRRLDAQRRHRRVRRRIDRRGVCELLCGSTR